MRAVLRRGNLLAVMAVLALAFAMALGVYTSSATAQTTTTTGTDTTTTTGTGTTTTGTTDTTGTSTTTGTTDTTGTTTGTDTTTTTTGTDTTGTTGTTATVLLCHATSSASNPFDAIVVEDGSTQLEGHLEHEDDFFPDVENPELLSDEEAEAICDAGPTDTTDTTGTTGTTDTTDTTDDGGTNGGDVNSPEDVIDDTTSKQPLPNTGGVPLLGLAAVALALVGVGFSVLGISFRRDP